ncbi:MAG: hypothetical protein SVW57_00880 [Thermodesulfobacteriota bacterium]|nr:hypothetical protein [Thermodesulfobacteriota bacterium]
MQCKTYELLIITFALIGFISSVSFVVHWIKQRYILKAFSWKDVTYGAKKIISDLKSRSFSPDIVVCLGRGGCILGGMVAGNMGIVRVCIMDRRKVTTQEDTLKPPDFFIRPNLQALKSLSPSPNKLNILLITGEVVSGFDLYHAKLCLESDLIKQGVNYELVTASFSSSNIASAVPTITPNYGIKVYRTLPWKLNSEYVNDRREDKLFHQKENNSSDGRKKIKVPQTIA